MKLPTRVKIVDVGPRDGLQNEKQPVPADIKIGLPNNGKSSSEGWFPAQPVPEGFERLAVGMPFDNVGWLAGDVEPGTPSHWQAVVRNHGRGSAVLDTPISRRLHGHLAQRSPIRKAAVRAFIRP